MPTIREARYAQLRRCGFLRSEAMVFSRFNAKAVPYMVQLINQRAAQYSNFNLNNRNMAPKERLAKWDECIQKLCQQNGWYKDWKNPKTGNTKRVVDPYAELREREDAYKSLNRQYESPHQKRWRDFQSFERKLEKSLRI